MLLTRSLIEKHFGASWVDFMSEFAESEQMDTILNTLKAQKASGVTILPDTSIVFRAFRETPLDQVRVVIVGQDPYPRLGYPNGLAFGHGLEAKLNNVIVPTPLAPSLAKIIDAVEVDCYSGLMLEKASFDTTLESWSKQGVLLLNAALTVVENTPASHAELWRDFTTFVLEKLFRVKRSVIALGWGTNAADALKVVNPFFHFMPTTCEHPSAAAKAGRPWPCKHFSETNAVIIANRLGDTIKW